MKIDDELQALWLLSSLPKSWYTLIVTRSNSAPEGKLTMDTVVDSLLNEQARRKERGMVVQFEANIVENRIRSENHTRSAGRSRNLEDDLNLSLLGLPATIVASQVTRNLNVDISRETKNRHC